MGLRDYAVIAMVLAAVVYAVFRMKKRRGNGCSGSCATCAGCRKWQR